MVLEIDSCLLGYKFENSLHGFEDIDCCLLRFEIDAYMPPHNQHLPHNGTSAENWAGSSFQIESSRFFLLQTNMNIRLPPGPSPSINDIHDALREHNDVQCGAERHLVWACPAERPALLPPVDLVLRLGPILYSKISLYTV